MLSKNSKGNYEDNYEHEFEITNHNETWDGCDAMDRDEMYHSPLELCLNYVNYKIDQRFL